MAKLCREPNAVLQLSLDRIGASAETGTVELRVAGYPRELQVDTEPWVASRAVTSLTGYRRKRPIRAGRSSGPDEGPGHQADHRAAGHQSITHRARSTHQASRPPLLTADAADCVKSRCCLDLHPSQARHWREGIQWQQSVD